MNFALPWALVMGLTLPLVYWLHRRALASRGQLTSFFFLLPAHLKEGGQGGKIREPLLLGVRLIALATLILAVAGPRIQQQGGTLILAADAFEPLDTWARPLTVVRAGTPPSIEAAPDKISAVAGPPNWGAALLLGRRHAPGSALVKLSDAPPRRGAIISAGVGLDGDEHIITARVRGAGHPHLEINGQRHELEERNDHWFLRKSLSAGPAKVRIGDSIAWPLCLPDPSTVTVSKTGWPQAVDAVLDALPHVERVPAPEAEWHPAEPAPVGQGWAPFAERRMTFTFLDEPNHGLAPLWFAEALPSPGAVVRRWRGVGDGATPILFAGDEVVVGLTDGPEGLGALFGFHPRDTDLTQTAGWPVLFTELLDRYRQQRGTCHTHAAGSSLMIFPHGQLTIEDPDGQIRVLPSSMAAKLIDGLDVQGIYTLSSGKNRAHIAVQPETGPSNDGVENLSVSAGRPPVRRMALVLVGGLFLFLALVIGGRSRSWLAWVPLACVLMIGLEGQFGTGEPGPVVLAVDVSSSMPQAALKQTVKRLEQSFGKEIAARVEGDYVVRRVRAPGMPLSAGGAGTRHQPLLKAASELAGDAGVIVLVSDGRSVDGPVGSDVPVFTVGVESNLPDAWVSSGRAVRLGELVFATVVVGADRTMDARVDIEGAESVDVKLVSGQSQTVQAVFRAGERNSFVVRVKSPEDRAPQNNHLSVVVEGAQGASAVVFGGEVSSWAVAAGLIPMETSVERVSEEGAQLTRARAVLVHDIQAGVFGAVLEGRLRHWVEAGGMLMLSGREQAFGAGDWSGSELDSLSPLASDPRPPGRGRIAMTLLLDRSGSVSTEAGGVGLDRVGALASGIAQGLAKSDVLSVMAFGADAQTLLPPTEASEVHRTHFKVPTEARGGTLLGPAIMAAIENLAKVSAEQRMIVVLSDGRFADADSLSKATRSLSTNGVKFVGLMVGDNTEKTVFENLAKVTGGLVLSPSPERLQNLIPSVVLRAAAGSLQVDEESEVVAEPAWSGRVGGMPPSLGRRIRTSAKPGARVLASSGGDPLLAEWSIGRGRVIALATDAWNLSSEQWAALLAPATAPMAHEARFEVRDDTLWYVAGVGDATPVQPVELRGAQQTYTLGMVHRAPGRASAVLPVSLSHIFEASVLFGEGRLVQTLARRGNAELMETGLLREKLALQAQLTGGTDIQNEAHLKGVLHARGRTGGVPFGLLGLMFALLFALLDWAAWAGLLAGRSAPLSPAGGSVLESG